MKRKKKWQPGRQMLALFMAVAFAMSGLNIGAVQAASQDEVVVTGANDTTKPVHVVLEKESTIAAGSWEGGGPAEDLAQYKVSVVNNSSGMISDWQLDITCSSLSTYNAGWNGAPSKVSGNTLTIETYRGTNGKGETWSNSEIKANGKADGAGFQMAARELEGASYTLRYHTGESSGNVGQDDTVTDPSAIGTTSSDVTAVLTKGKVDGAYHEYYLQVNNKSSKSIGDWLVAIPMSGVYKTQNWTSWSKVKVYYTSDYLYLAPNGSQPITAGGTFGATTGDSFKFCYEGGSEPSGAVVYYKEGQSSTGAFDNVLSNASGASGSSGGSGGVQGDETTDVNLDVEYNFAKLLQESLYFYDANMCGELEGKCALSWRKNCHTYDKTAVKYNGKTVDVSGGFHDAGDHDKFGLPQGYSATMLGIGYYEFKQAYEELGQSEHFETILDYFCDYFVRCTVLDDDGNAQAFCYQVGDGASHNSWVAAEDEKINRPAYFADASNPATDQVSEAAAALAIHYMNFGDKNYLDYAKKLFALAKNNKKEAKSTDGGGFYSSSSWSDDYCLAAAWLYKATGDSTYKTEYDAYKSTVDVGAWPGWDQVGPYAIAYGSNDVSKLESNFSATKSQTSTISNGYSWLCKWGSARYNCNMQMEGLVIDKHNGKNQYTDWATGQMKFLLGNSKDKRCYVVGYNENSSKYPHHRSSSGYGGFPDSGYQHTVQAHVLLGALVGGIEDASGTYHDSSADYYCNEVAIDYNAAFTGAAAALYLANKETDGIDSDLLTAEELEESGVSNTYSAPSEDTSAPKKVTVSVPKTITVTAETKISEIPFDEKEFRASYKGTAVDGTFKWETKDQVLTAEDDGMQLSCSFVPKNAEQYSATSTYTVKVSVKRKTRTDVPTTPEISSYTSNTITVTKKEDVKYGISTDGKTYEWQTDNVFTGLSSYTKHFVACRYPQTASYTASEASKPAVVTTYFDETDCKKIDLSKLADKTYVEAHDGTITYDEKTKTVTLVSERADQSYTITGENSDVTIKSAGAQVDLNNASVKRVESEENITVTITGNNVVADGINSAKNVTIKTKEDANASLDVSSGAEAAIFGENVTVESGKLTATGKNLPAIKADKTVTIAGGTVKADVTGDAEELPAAVTAATIKITNGAVESDNKNVFSTEPEDESGSKIKFVTITYKADGEEPVVAKVAKNAEYILPAPEEKEGYQAKGWTLAGDETEKVYQIGEKITASENMVFEAVYEKITGTLGITVKSPAEDLTYGYTVDEGIVVTVQNNANVAVNNITVSLSSEEDFTITSGDTTIKTLAPGESAQFTVTLKNKKSAGTYTVTFTATASHFDSGAPLTRVVKEAQKEDPDDTKGDNKQDQDNKKDDNKQDQDNKKDDNKQDQGDQKGDDNKKDQGDQKGDDNKQDQTNQKPDDTKKPDTAASTTTAAAPTTESSPAASTTEDVEEDLFTPELACTNVLMQKGKSTKLTTNGSGVKITSVKYANAKSKKIVKATSSGKLKALKTGKAILRVTYEYEGEAYTEKVTVKVIKTPVVVLTKKSMSVKLAKGKTAMLVQSDDMFATKDMKFRSSNSKVVKVTSKGQIKALKKKKSAVIKITIDDEEYKVKVTVK